MMPTAIMTPIDLETFLKTKSGVFSICILLRFDGLFVDCGGVAGVDDLHHVHLYDSSSASLGEATLMPLS